VERQTELTAESLWNDVSARLREALNDTTYSTWFGEVDGASLDDDTFAVAVPNDFTREWIEGHFLDLIRAAVKDASGKELRVQLRVEESAVPPAHWSGPGGQAETGWGRSLDRPNHWSAQTLPAQGRPQTKWHQIFS